LRGSAAQMLKHEYTTRSGSTRSLVAVIQRAQSAVPKQQQQPPIDNQAAVSQTQLQRQASDITDRTVDTILPAAASSKSSADYYDIAASGTVRVRPLSEDLTSYSTSDPSTPTSLNTSTINNRQSLDVWNTVTSESARNMLQATPPPPTSILSTSYEPTAVTQNASSTAGKVEMTDAEVVMQLYKKNCTVPLPFIKASDLNAQVLIDHTGKYNNLANTLKDLGMRRVSFYLSLSLFLSRSL
jgi:hypothetical protein